MSDNDNVQKNLNMRAAYAEALEQAAEEVYGSRYKQARVVEDLLDQTRFQPDSSRIEDDLKRNRFASGPDVEMPDEEEEEESVEEMSVGDKLTNLKQIDDKGAAVAEWLRERGPQQIERQFVVNLIQNEAGYSQSMAYNIARDALEELVPSPFNDADLDEWARQEAEKSEKRFASFEAFAGVDEEDVPEDVWFKSESEAQDAYQRALVKMRISDVRESRKETAFDKLVSLRPSYVDREFVESEREEFEAQK